MKPEDALAVLDAAASCAPLTRQQHQAVLQALNVLGSLISRPAAPRIQEVPPLPPRAQEVPPTAQ